MCVCVCFLTGLVSFSTNSRIDCITYVFLLGIRLLLFQAKFSVKVEKRTRYDRKVNEPSGWHNPTYFAFPSMLLDDSCYLVGADDALASGKENP